MTDTTFIKRTMHNHTSQYRILAVTLFFAYSTSSNAQMTDFNHIKNIKETAETSIQSLKTKFEQLKTAAKGHPSPTNKVTPSDTKSTVTSEPNASVDIQQGVGKMSVLRGLVSAKQIEMEAYQQYQQLLQEASDQRTLGLDNEAQVIRLRAIAQKIIPFANRWNERAVHWKWEVNLIKAKEINAFCMPGGKIVFYSGILDTLKLSDDEAAIVMGHEIAHALREHGRERVGKSVATQGVLAISSSLLGLGDTGRVLADVGANLLTLKFGRENETEGDLIGMDLAARAGYDPRAGVILWQKMSAANKGAPPQWLSTHPSGKNRIAEISKHLPKVLPIYAKTRNVTVAQLPAYQTNWPALSPVK
jgi:predicted Zn-dependent protease